MNPLLTRIIPITKARGKLGDLAGKVKGENYVILTKGGKPEAALVDVEYLAQLEGDLAKLYQKTFIDPQLLAFTREFTAKEIAEWKKEDEL
ncbi:type II toxin-antitoxin system Phd/YefM family antitoxin [Candidatus Parcubacteria bacterium]|nr:type II toxin-antitoxin system Phd/YefM family antitoxin [Candidatus Parcubacteria bacterium]